MQHFFHLDTRQMDDEEYAYQKANLIYLLEALEFMGEKKFKIR